MSAATTSLQEAVIQQYSKQLRLPTLGGQFARLATQAIKEKQGHLSYLEALLQAEVEEREGRRSDGAFTRRVSPRSRRWKSSTLRVRHTFRRRRSANWRRVAT